MEEFVNNKSMAFIPMYEYDELKKYKEAYRNNKIIFDGSPYSAIKVMESDEINKRALEEIQAYHRSDITEWERKVYILEEERVELKNQIEELKSLPPEYTNGVEEHYLTELQKENAQLKRKIKKDERLLTISIVVMLINFFIAVFSLSM